MIGATLGGVWSDLHVRVLHDDELVAKSSGAIQKPETLNYRTLKPEPGGLFDPAVFGDHDEAEQLRLAGVDVRWTVSAPTARFGHIELAQPIVHPFYATHGIGDLAAAAGMPPEQVGQVLAQELVSLDGKLTPAAEVGDEDPTYGAAVFAERLDSPEDYIVGYVLVSPVATRPMVKTDSGWVTSHINDLYRRVINRSNRLRRLLELDAPLIINMNEQRMLQEAAGHLCFNGFGDKVLTGPGREPLVSLFELAQRDSDQVLESTNGSGPARGVRAVRVFEAIGFALGSAERPKPTSNPKIDFGLTGSPVPIPNLDQS